MTQGWIKLHRQIQNCFLWEDKPFDKCRAWIDLLLLANHEDKKIMFNGNLITVSRGQYLTSIRKLSDRWGWSKDKVVRHLSILESEQMIQRDSDSNRTLLTIVNYEVYQGWTDTDKDSNKDSDKDSDKLQTINKEYKELNNNNIVEIVSYLNSVCGTNYQAKSEKTKSLIRARLKEGFTVEDFKTVIDKKTKEWKDDSKMSEYLRPITLFGTKFESYLNQTEVVVKAKNPFNQFTKNEYDYDELEKLIKN